MTTIPPVEPIKVLAMILQAELVLADGHIMIGLENWAIPKDTGLYVALFYGPEQVIGNNEYNGVDEHGAYAQVNEAIMLHQVDVDIMSFDSSARTRKEEVLWALKSYEAISLMEQYQMRFASTPGAFVPVQTLEETKQLNRYRITVGVNAIWRQTKTTPFYDSLQEVKLVENP